MNPVLEELVSGSQSGVLSQVQVDLTLTRASDWTSWTYARLITHYGLSCPNVLVHAFVRTACGRYWAPGFAGGRDAYLSDIDLAKFHSQAVEHAHDVDCLTVHDAITLAATLKRDRILRAREIMRICHLGLEAHLETESQPSRAWVYEIAEKCSLRIVAPQYLEDARRRFCDYDTITEFFVKYELLFHRDRRLIFNADETMLSGLKRFRVLAEVNKLPLVTAEAKLPHLTAMCAISAAGIVFKPFVILPKLRSLKRLSEFESDAHFATTPTGWMNRNLFTAWAICFCSELSVYRLTLPPEIRDEPILLILDGHPSRLHLEALTILDACGVDVLCLPAHSTHVLQPFDVAIASPLKVYFKKRLMGSLHLLRDADPNKREKTDLLRYIMCESFLDAYREATTRTNCAAGFRAAGIVPFAPDLPLSSQYMMDTRSDQIAGRRAGQINGMLLTGEEGLAAVALLQFGVRIDRANFTGGPLENVCHRLMNASVTDGRQISQFPPMILQVGPRLWSEITL
jgi:hypothetical protein